MANYPYDQLNTPLDVTELEKLNNNYAKIQADIQSAASKTAQDLNIQQQQINNLVVEGDSSPEAAQARVNVNGVDYPTLKDRLDADFLSKATGSPKGVYATVSALQTAKPTGDSNIYLVTADGKWYYHNGTVWTAGGVYQATALASNSVTKDMVTFIVKPINFFDKTSPNILEGKYIDSELTPETIFDSTTTYVTDYIEANAGDTIRVPVVANILARKLGAFYDANKQFISGIAASSVVEANGVRTITVPSNSTIRYVRINGRNNTSTIFYRDTFMVVKNISYPTSYVAYSLPSLDESLGLNATQKQETSSFIANTSTVAKNRLSGKIVAFLGDSITVGVGEVVRTGWAGRIATANNMTYTNYGVAGATVAAETYSGSTPRTWLCRKVTDLRTDADFIILQGGINDKLNNVPLGTITSDYVSTFDETTFCGGFESMIKQCIVKYPGKRIGFIVTYKVEGRHFPYGATTPQAEVYFNKAKEICEKWSIPVLDLYADSGITVEVPSIKTALMPDGIHVNEAGYDLITPKIEAFMRRL